MTLSSPIYKIAKDLGIDSNRVLLACKTIGIKANGATKRLNKEEVEKVKNYFETGKDVSEEIVEINNNYSSTKNKLKNIRGKNKTNFFPNRLIAKS